MRTLLTVAAAAAFLPAALARGYDALLADGKRLPGSLTLVGGRLRLSAGEPAQPVAVGRIVSFRFSAPAPAPFLAGVTHVALLPGGQRLGGELLAFDADGATLRTPWRDRLVAPRGALEGVVQPPVQLTLLDEDFEEGLKAWQLAGAPATTARLRTSGKFALLLERPGQSATYELAAPLDAGHVGVNFHVPEAVSGGRWDVTAEFAGTNESAARVTVAGAGDAYAVAAPTPKDEGVRVPRAPGWHRLAVDFTPTSLLLTVDDRLLWFGRERGPGGPLRRLRLSCDADGAGGEARGAVAFDEVTLARSVDEARRPPTIPTHDEAWLAAGDQLFGRLLRADRRGFDWEGRSGKRHFSWTEARGVFPARVARPPRATAGEQVRVWLRPASGSVPDELEGVAFALDERRLTLRHAALGDLDIPRDRLLRLRPLFHGGLIEVDNGVHVLGAGPSLTRGFRVDTLPAEARLVLTVGRLGGRGTRTEVLLNGERVDDLDRHAGTVGDPVRVTVPFPRGGVRRGGNTLELRQTREVGTRRATESVVADLAVEVLD